MLNLPSLCVGVYVSSCVFAECMCYVRMECLCVYVYIYMCVSLWLKVFLDAVCCDALSFPVGKVICLVLKMSVSLIPLTSASIILQLQGLFFRCAN